MFEEMLPGLVVTGVLEGDGGGDKSIDNGDGHHQDVKCRMFDDLLTKVWSTSFLSELINCHKTPFSLVSLQHLLSCTAS